MSQRMFALVVVLALAACDSTTVPVDAGRTEDAGPVAPVSTDHCSYVPLPPTSGAGRMVTEGALTAGTAERFLQVPLGVTLGAYTARTPTLGGEGFVDDRVTELAGVFAPSLGIETWPRARALALSTSEGTEDEETLLLIKLDVGVAYQGLVHELEARLADDYAVAGKIVISTSHSHSSFANYQGHSGLQVGFGPFQRRVFDAIVDDLEAVAREALEAREPARIGIAYEAAFDPDDRVTRDRRMENDVLAGGPTDDPHLYVMRVESAAGAPLAMIPIFGMHGTVHGADNVIASTDSTGGVERVLEEIAELEGLGTLVMHLQGTGGDVSPVGLEGATRCEGDLCVDFARAESVGHHARDEILAVWDRAGMDMRERVEMEVITRSIERGPDWERFRVRDGELYYLPWDARRVADGMVVDAMGGLISPIDEFNAPYGAALCGDPRVAIIPQAQMPGTSGLTEWSYRSCNRIEQIALTLGVALSLDLEEGVLCDTTRTTLSAFRIGEWYFATIPGEPVTLLSDRLRELAPVPEGRLVVLGYAQDNNGYVMTAEDWVRMGYEPTITFWGPLDGEQIMERSVELLGLLGTAEREDATAGGTTRVVVPDRQADAPIDDPAAGVVPGAVPAALPAHIETRLEITPPRPQPSARIARLESAYFTWIGDDPQRGTPVVTLERASSASGPFEPVRRRSGRPVQDGDLILTWTPDPLNHDIGVETRTHYWTVEWQAVSALGESGHAELRDRTGVALGFYRFSIAGPGYTVTSEPFEVVAATLGIEGAMRTGGMVTARAGLRAERGYRLLDLSAGATQLVPAQGPVRVEIEIMGGSPVVMSDVAIDASGMVGVEVAGTPTRITITDVFGNSGSAAL